MEKNHFFTLKKIKNWEMRKKKKKTVKQKELQVKNGIHSPPKFLNPFAFHRTMSDLIIFDNIDIKNMVYISPINSLIKLKHITSIDFQNNYFSINFEDPGNYPLSPTELLIYRLSSLGNSEAYNLACSLKNYIDTFTLILKARSLGNSKQLFDKLDSNIATILINYFENLSRKSMNEEEWSKYFEKFQEENKEIPCFCLIFSEYRPFLGLQLINFIINKTLKKILPCDDLNMIEQDLFCIDAKEYFNIISETIKNMNATNHLENGTFFVKTKIGIKKMIFEMKKLYIDTKMGRKVAILYTFKQDEQLEDIQKFLKFLEEKNAVEINHILFTKQNKKIEKNEKWNKLIELYYTSHDQY